MIRRGRHEQGGRIAMTTWDMIRSERVSLVDALGGLPADAWGKP
jgi:hypothetical protein